MSKSAVNIPHHTLDELLANESGLQRRPELPGSLLTFVSCSCNFRQTFTLFFFFWTPALLLPLSPPAVSLRCSFALLLELFQEERAAQLENSDLGPSPLFFFRHAAQHWAALLNCTKIVVHLTSVNKKIKEKTIWTKLQPTCSMKWKSFFCSCSANSELIRWVICQQQNQLWATWTHASCCLLRHRWLCKSNTLISSVPSIKQQCQPPCLRAQHFFSWIKINWKTDLISLGKKMK